MTIETVELVLGKAILNAGFRDLLFAKPEEALSGFNLTSTEKHTLLHLDSETLEFLAQTLNRCILPKTNSSPYKKRKKK